MSHQASHAEHAHHAHDHHHHEIPTGGSELTLVAASATLHCLTGCALGEIAGMAIGTALGLGNFETIVLAVGLAFLFGYTLTSLPLLRAGLALSAVIPIALASDTFSIATMEIVDNLVMVVVPGAMDAGLGDVLFWGALSFALAVAFVFALPVNRWLIARGKGHVAVHETGIHGGPSPRAVGVALALAAVFGVSVLVAEAVSDDGGGHMDGMETAAGGHHQHHGGMPAHGGDPAPNLRLDLDQPSLPRGERTPLAFQILDEDGDAVVEFETEHEREMHLIVVRRDLTGFQHLHPKMAADGTWTTPILLPGAGDYRVFADFRTGGESLTIDRPLRVPGGAEYAELPPERSRASTASGYEVRLVATPAEARAGATTTLSFHVTRGGDPVEVERYLGANGHLVALRQGDLEFLHVHPTGDGIDFATEFPGEGRYRLFLQFKHEGDVHTAEFTREVGR